MSEEAERALRTQAKQVLRERMRSVRRVLPEEACRARSALACERLWSLPELQQAPSVVFYRAARKELDVAPLLERAAQSGKRVGLPRVIEDGGLELRVFRSGDALIEGAFGLQEPAPDAEPIAPSEVRVIVVPALAIDARGHRIGYGHGYYDRLLARLPQAFAVAVGYDFQLLAELPETAGDVRVQCIVTDLRTLRVR